MKMAVLPQGHAFCVATAMALAAISYLKIFENQSLIDFQIGNERKREFRAVEMRFYLYKEFSRGTM